MVKELEAQNGRLRPCKGCPTVQCTCLSELEEQLLNQNGELERRLKRACDALRFAHALIAQVHNYADKTEFWELADELERSLEKESYLLSKEREELARRLKIACEELDRSCKCYSDSHKCGACTLKDELERPLEEK